MSSKSVDVQLKRMDIAAYVLSVVVILLVIVMRMPEKINFGIDFSFLPPVYSVMNALVAVALLLALYFIKQKNIKRHKQSIYVALVLSTLFLLSYVVYHFTTPETKYCGEGTLKRTVYFILLISHIFLAGAILPFILITFNRGYLMVIERHKKIAKWVYPLWLYVAVTGPIIYLMLSPCYQ